MDKQYKLVIFDADGTLTPFRNGTLGEFSYTLLPGVEQKCAELRKQGVILALASNQSARRSSAHVIEQITWTAERLQLRPDLLQVSVDPATQKPNPYMLLEIMHKASASPEEVLMVGDAPTDEEAAQAAGVDFCYAAIFFGE